MPDAAHDMAAPTQVGDLTCGELLADSGLPSLEARALLAHVLGVSRERLIAHPEHRVAGADARRFNACVHRRQSGEPVAYLLGEKEFYGRVFKVTPAVLIPRPETELLVDIALNLQVQDEANVLDLGTGSGCIAISLALQRPRWRVTATDVSSDALDIARTNAERLRADNVTFRRGNWFDAVSAANQFDLIVANPPYVAPDDEHLQALTYEPMQALVAWDGGRACLRAIIEAAPRHLATGGWLVLEHGYQQGAVVRELFAPPGWREVRTFADLSGHERVTCGRMVV